MSHKDTVVLIDASSYVFRAYHALPPLTSKEGLPTGVLYGVMSMLERTVAEASTPYVACVFDSPGATHRHTWYPEYKANRPETPDDLKVQIPLLWDLLQARGIPVLRQDGTEADDLIGTLACFCVQQGFHVTISTGDKDFAQLVSEDITLLNTMTQKKMDRAGVFEKFGVYPEQIIDYLSLMGDSVDNVPGIPKVGPKTAAKWLNQYQTLDNLCAHASDISGKIGETFRAHLDTLPLSKKLVTIMTSLSLDWGLEDLKLQQPDPRLIDLYQQYGFDSLVKRWHAAEKESPVSVQVQAQAHEAPIAPVKEMSDRWEVICVEDNETLEAMLSVLHKAPCIAFDTETTHLLPMQARCVGMSFCVDDARAYYLPLRHLDGQKLLWDDVAPLLQRLFARQDVLWIGHHIKYDLLILRHEGWDLAQVEDTMLMSYVLASTEKHGLDACAQRYLGYRPQSFEELAGKGAQQKRFDAIAIEDAAFYAAEDAWVTWKLYHVLCEHLRSKPSLLQVYETLERPLIPILTDMEWQGVYIDAPHLQQLSALFEKTLAALEEEAYQLAGETFNLASPKQLQSILFEKLQLPVQGKTAKGQASTSEAVLQELIPLHPLPALLLQHRSLSKLKSTYTDKLVSMRDPHTGRVHTSYHQALTSTGRLSSSDPNLQNIPIRTEQGRQIRQAFCAPQGRLLISADYSQIELRIMAHLSEEPELLKAFASHQDVHRYTASQVFAVPMDAVTFEQRRHAKAINFGLIYGMSAYGLSQQIQSSVAQAQAFMDQYFARYPAVKRYMEKTRLLAREQGYVETVFHRRLYVPDISSANVALRRAAERLAINAPMQGSAADIIKSAMIALWPWLQKHRARIKLLLQVHDELIFEVDEDFVAKAQTYIQETMQKAGPLVVPCEVASGCARTWEDAH